MDLFALEKCALYIYKIHLFTAKSEGAVTRPHGGT
jgi:hypothetical protein